MPSISTHLQICKARHLFIQRKTKVIICQSPILEDELNYWILTIFWTKIAKGFVIQKTRSLCKHLQEGTSNSSLYLFLWKNPAKDSQQLANIDPVNQSSLFRKCVIFGKYWILQTKIQFYFESDFK